MTVKEPEIVKFIRKKDIDFEKAACLVMKKPGYAGLLLDMIFKEKGSVKFVCEKVLRLVSERQPELLYPHFDDFVKMLDTGNTFLKCGAILTIANLTPADSDDKFNKIFGKYFSSVLNTSLICACNVIGASVKIADAKPELVNRIAKELLKVEDAEYISKGEVSPECRNVAIGQALNSFEHIYEKISSKKPVADFVKRQLKNPRQKVAEHAGTFIAKHKIDM